MNYLIELVLTNPKQRGNANTNSYSRIRMGFNPFHIINHPKTGFSRIIMHNIAGICIVWVSTHSKITNLNYLIELVLTNPKQRGNANTNSYSRIRMGFNPFNIINHPKTGFSRIIMHNNADICIDMNFNPFQKTMQFKY